MLMMFLYPNKSLVLRLIQRATKEYPNWQLGKKALQKSLSFVNLKCNCLNFKWEDYGPMSGEVQQIAHDLKAVGKVKITETPTKKQNAFIKSMTSNANATIAPELNDALEKTLEFVAGKSAKELELLVSVHFWVERCNADNDTTEYVFQKLDELRPDAAFTKTDVEESICEMKKHNILS